MALGKVDSGTVQSTQYVLLSIHYMLSGMMGAPEMQLAEDEAAALAEAITNVQRFYPASVMGEKGVAWMALLAAIGSVYGPRVGIIRDRMRTARGKGAPKPAPESPVEPAPPAPDYGAFSVVS